MTTIELREGDIPVAAAIRRSPGPLRPRNGAEVAPWQACEDRASRLPALAEPFERAVEAVLVTDSDGVITHVNRGFELMTGYARSEAIGRTPAILSSGHHPRDFYRELWNALRAGREFRGTFVNRRKDGALFREEKTICPLLDGQGSITNYLSVGRDVSSHAGLIDRLAHAATHDFLTDLPNRSLFNDRLGQALRHSARTGVAFAIVIVDIDRFKAINDALGHAAGDAVIREVAARLQRCVRDADTVARIGGDEFGLLLLDQRDAAKTERVLRAITRAIGSPMRAAGAEFAVTISAGASLCSADVHDAQALVHCADRAMYGAKRAGGNGYLVRRRNRGGPEVAAILRPAPPENRR